MPLNNEIQALVTALRDAKAHLEYCNYGDAWEREMAQSSGLAQRIDAALAPFPENPATPRQPRINPIGRNQRAFLDSVRKWHSYTPGGGWTWGNTSTSLRMAESLVRRGLLVKATDKLTGRPRYTLAPGLDIASHP